MATQVRPPSGQPNFKPPRIERGHKQSDARDERPGMDEKHLANVRKLPCCIRGCPCMPGGEAHHIKRNGANERGMGIRTTDRWAVPLCHTHHIDGVERAGAKNELKWFEGRGVDALDLAVALWGARGDLPKMTRIVIEQKTSRLT